MKKIFVILILTLTLYGCSGNIDDLYQALDNYQQLSSGEVVYSVKSDLPFFMLSEQKYEITFNVKDNIVIQDMIQDENVYIHAEYDRADNSIINQTRYFTGNESNIEDISDREPFLVFNLFDKELIADRSDFTYKKENGYDVYEFDDVTFYVRDNIIHKQVITELYDDGYKTIKTTQLISYE